MLKATYIELLQHYASDRNLIENAWREIETVYSNRKRHYHTLSHLDNLLHELIGTKEQVSDWHAMLFSLYYHDFVYNVFKKNNEEKSALVAEKKMTYFFVPSDRVDRCKDIILATKTHVTSTNNDVNIFTDADLSILGNNWETYQSYYKCIRKEYSIYPDFMYISGRKKVLTHFLQMDRIFKTDYFFEKFEAPARQNLQHELEIIL